MFHQGFRTHENRLNSRLTAKCFLLFSSAQKHGYDRKHELASQTYFSLNCKQKLIFLSHIVCHHSKCLRLFDSLRQAELSLFSAWFHMWYVKVALKSRLTSLSQLKFSTSLFQIKYNIKIITWNAPSLNYNFREYS